MESFTGGSIASEIVKVPGASNVFVCGKVCYSNESKIKELSVSSDTIDSYGAVSEQTATEMVRGALAMIGADYAVATTGNAGPTAEKEGEVGVCYVAVASRDFCNVQRFIFKGKRIDVINQGKKQALKMLADLIQEKN